MDMHIKLSPINMPGTLALEKTGDTLSINGHEIDFSVLPLGATIPAENADNPLLFDKIFRDESGALHLIVMLPLGDNPSPERAFPEPLFLTTDGAAGVPQPLEGEYDVA